MFQIVIFQTVCSREKEGVGRGVAWQGVAASKLYQTTVFFCGAKFYTIVLSVTSSVTSPEIVYTRKRERESNVGEIA